MGTAEWRSAKIPTYYKCGDYEPGLKHGMSSSKEVALKDLPPPKKESKPKLVPMPRPALGRRGKSIQLLTNHFKVSVRNVNEYFYHYSVHMKHEDDHPVDGKGIGRRVIDQLYQTYHSELGDKKFAYDGEKSLFTIGSLPNVKNEFIVILEESSNVATTTCSESPDENIRKRMRHVYKTKKMKVEINFAAKIPMQSIAMALKGHETEHTQEALRVLDIILRQHAAKRGCLLVRQSFFHDNRKNFADIGGSVLGCRGFHSSFRPAQGGLSLNIDVSTTMIVKPGPVVNFLIENQNVRDPFSIDWAKAKRTLKSLRIKAVPSNQEFKIIGLSDLPCNKQLFTLKQRGNKDGEMLTVEITVHDYFVKHRNIGLRFSADLPCINVGKPKRPTYLPIELCTLVSLQRYTKSLTSLQRASLVEKSRQKPHERMTVLSTALKSNDYDSDPMLRETGVSISTQFTQVDGRVLQAPKLKVGNGEDFMPRNGRWNFNNKKLFDPVPISNWAIVNFSARCDLRALVRDFIKCGNMKGIVVSSRAWPSISRYRACVKTQSPKIDMIDSLFKPSGDRQDDGMIKELMVDFYTSSGKRKPENVIIFRDGVSESQFNQVLNIELGQIIAACKHLDESWNPKFTLLIAQKNHHTKFFQPTVPDNVPPGTVVDNKVCHPRNYDFYMCSHAGMIGTSRPTHYHVLLDEIGFSPDDLQELVHALSYVYQRSTTAISVVAPICYAHLAATQMSQFMKFEDLSEATSSHGGITASGAATVPELPKLHEKLSSTMFFC